MKLCYAFLIAISIVSCKEKSGAQEITNQPQSQKKAAVADSAMVVSARAEASKIGTEILKMGGNAFDAMIATEMALAVCYPYAGNLGGGGFMVYRSQYGEIGSLDYREKAPMAATKNMYLDNDGTVIPNKSSVGAMAVGVPGTVAGIFAVHEKFGSLPMEVILKPVIELAKKGYVVTEQQQIRFEKFKEDYKGKLKTGY